MSGKVRAIVNMKVDEAGVQLYKVRARGRRCHCARSLRLPSIGIPHIYEIEQCQA